VKNQLRALRQDHNWSQAVLAGELRVSRQTVNSLETGRYDPSLSLAFRVARLFGQPIEAIFFPDDPSNPGGDHPSRAAAFRKRSVGGLPSWCESVEQCLVPPLPIAAVAKSLQPPSGASPSRPLRLGRCTAGWPARLGWACLTQP